MKFLAIISNPLVVIISFLFIIVSGEHTGGFYFSYLYRALPHGALYATLATIGVSLLLFTIIKPVSKVPPARSILNEAGGLLLIMSVYVFFAGDSTGYNIDTFSQAVPLITMIIFLLLAGWFIYINFVTLLKKK